MEAAYRLCSAAFEGNVATIIELLDAGDDPSSADYDGRTALHIASEGGHAEVVKVLINRGADVQVADRWGVTPLRGALKHLHRDVAEQLQDAGAVLGSGTAVADFSEETEALLTVFQSVAHSEDVLTVNHIEAAARNIGYPQGIATCKPLRAEWEELSGSGPVNFARFQEWSTESCDSLLLRVLKGEMRAVPDWTTFVGMVTQLFEDVRALPRTGANADYIPSLAEYDSDLFGLSIVTVDGQVLQLGDADCQFPIESCCKPILYALALQKTSRESVHQYVGQEPSGHAFNAFMLTPDNKPHNPCINAGAIMTSAILMHEFRSASRAFAHFTKGVSALGGGRSVGFNQAVYLSEKETAFTNYALTYYMRARGKFPDSVSSDDGLRSACDLYLQACSIEVDTLLCANVAATLANRGVNPLTGERVLCFQAVKATLSAMLSCGMYDYSGRWCFEIGIPAKSGVSGIIYMSLPERLGMAVYAPPLDDIGNSVRGVEFGRRFAETFKCNVFDLLFDATPGISSQ